MTAGTCGIGLEIARRLAENGAKVVVSSRRQENVDHAVELLRSDGHQAYGLTCNVGKDVDRKRLVSQVIESHGDVNVFVQNAGVNPHMYNIVKTPEPALDKTYDVHIKGNFRMIQELYPHMKKSEKPCSIILTSSVVAYTPLFYPGAYAITKAAINAMTRSFAPDLDKHNIRINCLTLGVFATEFIEEVKKSDEMWQKYDRFSIMKRFGNPSEAAGMAAYLASDDSSYVTGETFTVGGGFTTRV